MPTRSKPLRFLRGPAHTNQVLTGLNGGPVTDDAACEDSPIPDGDPNPQNRGMDGAVCSYHCTFHQQRCFDDRSFLCGGAVMQERLRPSEQGGLCLKEVMRLADVKPKPFEHQASDWQSCFEH